MNTRPENLLLAVLALAAYVVVVLSVWRRAVRKRRSVARLAGTPSGGPAPMLVAYASQTGTAEAIATQTADMLQTAGVEVMLRSMAQLDLAALQSAREVLFVVSTYGEGDPPDAAAHFMASVMRDSADLSGLHFGLLTLGDRSYRNFCGFGRKLEIWLRQHGASSMFACIEMDRGDPHSLQAWRRELGHIAAVTDLPQWQEVPFEPWILRDRRHLNSGSQGAPVFHLELVRQNAATDGWQAGDLLQVQVPGDPDRPRDYSIASIAADGAVHLLVRLQIRADGSAGGASAWLTDGLPTGAALRARLRVHQQFHIDQNANRDLILIGNGTGIAGLRAHLKQREAQLAGGASPRCHWLLFGERQAACDALYGAELEAWRASGLLARLDLVYSRDGGAQRYVQDCLGAQADLLRAWVDAGAAIYVCGSLEGMAEGVAAVLREHLGEALLAQMQQQGRYRRDVY